LQPTQRRKDHRTVLSLIVMRLMLQACSTLFGSLGIFFLYMSFSRPGMGGAALVFLAAATAIVWAVPPR
jgi:hypothetical protein